MAFFFFFCRVYGIDPNVFLSNTTDLVYEGVESAFFPVCVSLTQHSGHWQCSEPQAPTYLLSSGYKMFTEGEDVKE